MSKRPWYSRYNPLTGRTNAEDLLYPKKKSSYSSGGTGFYDDLDEFGEDQNEDFGFSNDFEDDMDTSDDYSSSSYSSRDEDADSSDDDTGFSSYSSSFDDEDDSDNSDDYSGWDDGLETSDDVALSSYSHSYTKKEDTSTIDKNNEFSPKDAWKKFEAFMKQHYGKNSWRVLRRGEGYHYSIDSWSRRYKTEKEFDAALQIAKQKFAWRDRKDIVLQIKIKPLPSKYGNGAMKLCSRTAIIAISSAICGIDGNMEKTTLPMSLSMNLW